MTDEKKKTIRELRNKVKKEGTQKLNALSKITILEQRYKNKVKECSKLKERVKTLNQELKNLKETK